MTETIAGELRDVSDTALWVAMYRAIESERPDALFRDPFARRLAGERGPRILDAIPHAKTMGWPMVVRTAVFDELLLGLVRAGAVDTVVDLAAGLDARPWRLDLPATLRWVDVDLPAMLAYKQAGLAGAAPRCRYQARAADLSDAIARRALLAELAADARHAVVLTEGLLIYLDPAEVAALARDLAMHAAFEAWILDLATPALVRRMDKTWGRAVARGRAPFRFAPAEGTAFFAGAGWREREWRSTWEEARRLNRRMRAAWMFDALAALSPPRARERWRRFSGIALLGR
ncbi:MAG TPA: SAM-dependent methyltransferase [Candidatus Eisenbacteria bacterium]|nr:SAM-dependent methyltransferase [Candidatus Eisenbacteria bacterium]